MKDLLNKIFTRDRIIIIVAIFLAVLSIVLLFDQILMPWYTKHGEALTVPNLIAQRYETAKDILEQQGLKAVKGGEKYDANLPFGYVVEQNPSGNRLVKKGRRVYLTISVGEKDVQVPNLVGLSENNAKEIIKSYSLRLGQVDYQYVVNEVADIVIEQSPAKKSFIKINSEIDLIVSLGEPKENATMPFVIGKTIETVKREIQKAGFRVGRITYKISDEFLPQTVIQQSINAGTITEHGAEVNLMVTVLTLPE